MCDQQMICLHLAIEVCFSKFDKDRRVYLENFALIGKSVPASFRGIRPVEIVKEFM
jgi:hypothetical protein